MIKVLTIVLGFAVFLSAREEPFAKYTRINCSASSTGPCVNPFCYVTLVNRYKTSVSAGCEKLSRPITKVFGEYKLSYKRLGNYHQIIHVKPMEVCEFFSTYLGQKKNILIKWMMDIYPGKVHLCPYKDKDLQVINSTAAELVASEPDGFYKNFASFKDEKADNIFTATWVVQVSNKHNIVGY